MNDFGERLADFAPVSAPSLEAARVIQQENEARVVAAEVESRPE